MAGHSFLLLVVLFAVTQGWQDEQKVLSTIFRNYDVRVPPTKTITDAVDVTMWMFLVKILNIERSQHTADVAAWVNMKWTDPRLTWNNNEYNKLDTLYVKSTLVWVPDISLYTGEGAVERMVDGDDRYKLEINSNGTIYYSFPLNQKIACIHKSKDHDDYECSFGLESWTTPHKGVSLSLKSKKIDLSFLSDYFIDPNYDIKSATLKITQQAYPSSPDTKYDIVNAKIVLRRDSDEDKS